MFSVTDGTRYGHAPHGSYLEVHDRHVDGFVVRCGRSGGGIIVIDQFVCADAQSGVNLVPHPGIVGNNQYTWHG